MLFSAKSFFPAMEGKRIDVIGFGVSNSELIFRLADAGAQVVLRDRHTAAELRPEQLVRLREHGVALRLGPDYLERLDGEIIFRTPGLPFTTPELDAARSRGQVVTSELEIFMEFCPCPVFGITGSDGKTTTASILAEMLKTTGRTVHLGGNIGKPLLPILDRVSENDLCVAELSSFQLLSMRTSPDVAVVTNISPNHLDVHRDMEEYVSAKCNVLDHQNAFARAVLSADNAAASSLASRVRGRLSWFSRERPLENGAWMDEEGNLFHSSGGRPVRLMHRSEVLLPGLHNVENLLAATCAAWGTVAPRQIAQVARTFGGVEHRIEFVRRVNGVDWYNDSIATSPTRTVAGLMSFEKKLILIAGGYDKHIPFEPMVCPVLERVKTLILTGDTAAKIEAAVTASPNYPASGLTVLRARDLEDAVAQAATAAKPGDVVTLSPACASFDAFNNFEERGRFYKGLVLALKSKDGENAG